MYVRSADNQAEARVAVTADFAVLVVEPNELVGWGLRVVLASQPWVSRCVVVGDAGRALEIATRYDVKVALIAADVRGVSGSQVSATLVRSCTGIRTVLLTRDGLLDTAALRAAGAWGSVGRDWPAKQVVAAVHRVGALGRMLPATAGASAVLSPQQLEVLRLMAAGATNREIALQLALSPHTIKDHAGALFRRLQVRNRTQAVQRGQSLGLLA